MSAKKILEFVMGASVLIYLVPILVTVLEVYCQGKTELLA